MDELTGEMAMSPMRSSSKKRSARKVAPWTKDEVRFIMRISVCLSVVRSVGVELNWIQLSELINNSVVARITNCGGLSMRLARIFPRLRRKWRTGLGHSVLSAGPRCSILRLSKGHGLRRFVQILPFPNWLLLSAHFFIAFFE